MTDPSRRRGSRHRAARSNGHRNVSEIAAIEHKAAGERSRFECMSAAISRVTGSLPFFLLHVAGFTGWIVVNAGWTALQPFDPYPFNLLTTAVSLEAIFLSMFVLMAQNLQTRDADRRAQLTLQIDLLAEQESTATLRMAHALCRAARIEVPIPHARLKALLCDTDVSEVARDVERGLDKG
jgi:uncharacterized membrane protein